MVKSIFLAAILTSTANLANGSTQVEVFAEAGFWGDRLVRIIDSAPVNDESYLVRYSTFVDEEMKSRASSVRLQCGDRGSRIYLSDQDNSSILESNWKGNTVFFVCQPNQTIEVNLHETKAYPSRQTIADNVKSLMVVVDAIETNDTTIITLFAEAGFWGKQFRIVRNRDNNISPLELYGLGLFTSISSIRMECGKFGHLLDLYSEAVGGPQEKILSCLPNQTKEYNLHKIWGASGFYLGDAIRRANIRTILQ